jgi:hypothetical protein
MNSVSNDDICQREYNALDEVILINDKRMAAAGKLTISQPIVHPDQPESS